MKEPSELEGLARVITANFGQRNVPIRLAANILDSAWMREHDRAVAWRAWEECHEEGVGVPPLRQRTVTANVREPRATTMRMIATELESGSYRARMLTAGVPYGFVHWLRIWADDIDPPPDTGEDGEN